MIVVFNDMEILMISEIDTMLISLIEHEASQSEKKQSQNIHFYLYASSQTNPIQTKTHQIFNSCKQRSLVPI